jgi:hypothetical protein
VTVVGRDGSSAGFCRGDRLCDGAGFCGAAGSCDDALEGGGAVIDSVAAAAGSLGRSAALPVTVRLTDVTADAVTGTVSCAWSWRGADLASTVPRAHEDVPSALPQPKLKPGATPLAGLAASLMTASVTFPPVAQALTVHWAGCPRSLLACARATSTQRLTCVACGTVLATSCAVVPVAVGVGLALRVRVGVGVALDVVGVADGVGLAEALTIARVCVADGDGVVLADAFGVVVFAGVDFVGVAAGLDFSVRVGAAVALADAAPESEALAVALAVVLGDALVVVDDGVADEVVGVADGVVGVALGVVGVAVGVVEVGVGLGEVEVEVGVGVGVGEGDGLDGAAGSCSGSHDSPLAVVAVLATAVLAATVRLAPETASRTLPAISVTVAGRACAKRMKRPISAARRGMSAIGHRAPGRRHPLPIPG